MRHLPTTFTTEPGTVTQISTASRARIREALSDALSPATKRAYLRHWESFENYCRINGYRPLPADVDVVCEFLYTLEHSKPAERTRGEGTYSVSYMDQAVAAIKYVHRSTIAMPDVPKTPALWEHPQLSDFMRAARNRAAQAGTAEPDQKAPILLDQLQAMLETAVADADTWRKHLHARRDNALLLMTWIGGMRRSEPISLRVRDVKYAYGKWTITLRRSKKNQTGKSEIKALPVGSTPATCPPCAYLRWMEAVATFDELGRTGLIRLLARDKPITEHICGHSADHLKPMSPVFRSVTRTCDIDEIAMSAQTLHTIVRRRLSAAFPEIDTTEYGAHSLRAGLITESLLQGKSLRSVMRQTGHRSFEGLLPYARERNAHDNNAATSLGL